MLSLHKVGGKKNPILGLAEAFANMLLVGQAWAKCLSRNRVQGNPTRKTSGQKRGKFDPGLSAPSTSFAIKRRKDETTPDKEIYKAPEITHSSEGEIDKGYNHDRIRSRKANERVRARIDQSRQEENYFCLSIFFFAPRL